MDHIFGDSDDISFWSPSSTPTPRPTARVVSTPSHDRDDTRPSHTPRPSAPRPDAASRPPREYTPRPPRPVQSSEPAIVDTTPALSRLIAGMKSSFLPREDDMTALRIVSLSSSTGSDPLFMMRSDDTTVLVGSGFSALHRSGHEYLTFPDMRLIFSEKDRLRAWVLTDATIDVTRFEFILPTLWFPPIYATRDVIASFRNNIKNTTFLESCRFFELFADGSETRRIGDIEFFLADFSMTMHLGIRSGGSSLALAHIILPSADLGSQGAIMITPSADWFTTPSETFVTGEVISFRAGVFSRHAMKFTFDTFFIDWLSIGVVAGYALGDRDQLSESGVLVFTLTEDTRARTISGHIFIDSRGFVHAYEMMYIHKEIIKGIRQTYEQLLTENPKIERGDLVSGLRREITKYCYLLTGRTPIVMPIVVER